MSKSKTAPVKNKPATKAVAALVVGANVSDTVNGLSKKATPIIRKLNMLEVKTKEDYDLAAKSIYTIKEYRDEAAVLQKGFLDPANTIIKNTRALFKPFLDLIDESERATKERMVVYLEKQEATAAKLMDSLESGKIKKLSTVVSKQNELLDNANDFSSVRKVKVLVIKNAKLIPLQYMVPDEAAIKKALLDGEKVPGCILEVKKSIAI